MKDCNALKTQNSSRMDIFERKNPIEFVENICNNLGLSTDIVFDLLPLYTVDSTQRIEQNSFGAIILSRIILAISHGCADPEKCERKSKADLQKYNDMNSLSSSSNGGKARLFHGLFQNPLYPSTNNDVDSSDEIRERSFGGKKIMFNYQHFASEAKTKGISTKWIDSIGLVTDLSNLLSVLQENDKDEKELNVVDVIEQCLKVIHMDDFMEILSTIHEKTFTPSYLRNPPPQSKPEMMSSNMLQRLLCDILGGTLREVRNIATFISDFNYLWTIMCKKFDSNIEINVTIKDCVWVLMIAFSSRTSYSTTAEGGSNYSVLTISAIIAIVASVEVESLDAANVSKKRKLNPIEDPDVNEIEEAALAILSSMTEENHLPSNDSKILNNVDFLAQEIQIDSNTLTQEVKRASQFICDDLFNELAITEKNSTMHPTNILQDFIIDADKRSDSFCILKKMYDNFIFSQITSDIVAVNDPASIASLFISTGIYHMNLCPSYEPSSTFAKNSVPTLPKTSNTKSVISATSSEFTVPKSQYENIDTLTKSSFEQGFDPHEVSSICVSNNGSESEGSSARELALRDYEMLNSINTNATTGTIKQKPILLADWIGQLSNDSLLRKPSKRLAQFMNLCNIYRPKESSQLQSIVSILDDTFNGVLQTLFSNETPSENTTQPFNIVSESGELIMDPELGEKFQNIMSSLISLYYGSLEQILVFETRRLQTSHHSELMSNDIFHRSLLAICCECVMKIHQPDFTTDIIIEVLEVDGYDLIKIMECFMRAMSRLPNDKALAFPDLESDPPLLLPNVMAAYLLRRETEIIEASIWVSACDGEKGGLIDAIASLHQLQSGGLNMNAWPPPCLEYTFDLDDDDDIRNLPVVVSRTNKIACPKSKDSLPVDLVLRKTLIVCARRIFQLAEKLAIDDFHMHRIWVAIRFFLRNHIYALYDRHIDHILLCCVYAICKITLGTFDITFAQIIEAYKKIFKERGEACNQKIIRHVLIESVDDGSLVFGNVIQFYNKVFVPTMKPHLVKNSDTDFLAKQKTKTGKVINHIVETARISHWNKAARDKQRVKNVVISNCLPEEKKDLVAPKSRTFYQFGAGGVNVSHFRLLPQIIMMHI